MGKDYFIHTVEPPYNRHVPGSSSHCLCEGSVMRTMACFYFLVSPYFDMGTYRTTKLTTAFDKPFAIG